MQMLSIIDVNFHSTHCATLTLMGAIVVPQQTVHDKCIPLRNSIQYAPLPLVQMLFDTSKR